MWNSVNHRPASVQVSFPRFYTLPKASESNDVKVHLALLAKRKVEEYQVIPMPPKMSYIKTMDVYESKPSQVTSTLTTFCLAAKR